MKDRSLVTSPAPRMTPAVAIVVLLFVSGLVIPGDPLAQPTDAIPAGWITPYGQGISFDDGHWGPNRLIEIMIGNIAYVGAPFCDLDGGHPDYWWAISDIYVINGTAPPVGALDDASGAPNTVFGTLGGGIAFEPIAITKPAGGLGTGVYSVVYDECEDGKFTPGQDAFFPGVIEVTIPVDVPPVDQGLVQFKNGAAQQQAHWKEMTEDWIRLHTSIEIMEYLLELRAAGDGLEKMQDLTGFFTKMKDFNEGMNGEGSGDQEGELDVPGLKVEGFQISMDLRAALKAATIHNLDAMTAHYGAIAKDPPDAMHDLPSTLPAHGGIHLQTEEALRDAAAAANNANRIESALLEALLHAVERYQGAAAAGNGGHALAQMDNAIRLLDALEAQVPKTQQAVSGLAHELRTDIRPLDELFVRLETMRQAVVNDTMPSELDGLGHDLDTAADPDTRLRHWMRELDFDIERNATADRLDTAAAAKTDLLDDLQALRQDLQDARITLLGQPAMEPSVPRIALSGPATASPGVPFTLTATADTNDTVVSYAWDLDADGIFDDADDASVVHDYEHDFDGFVSVLATDAEGDVGVAFTRITVAGDAPPRIDNVTPTTDGIHVQVGNTQAFTLDATDPEGSPVEILWFLNGTDTGTTGTAYTFGPATGAAVHDVKALVLEGDAQTARTVAHWSVRTHHPDVDEDGWRANVDCDDTDADVHPGAIDALNGIDDDCDPDTPDGGLPPLVETDDHHTVLEGQFVELSIAPNWTTAVNVSHPDRPLSEIQVTVDWDDGTTEPAALDGSGHVIGAHPYADDGEYRIAVCARPTGGIEACTSLNVTVSNDEPSRPLHDLRLWTEDLLTDRKPAKEALDEWLVSDTGSVVKRRINGNPLALIAPQAVGYGNTSFTMRVPSENTDDDFIGFTLGLEPDEVLGDDIDWWLVDWKRGDQDVAKRGLALSHITGPQPTYWGHYQMVDDDLTEVARGLTRGLTGWDFDHEYVVEIDLAPDRLRVYIDGTMEFDESGPWHPMRFGFYDFSQQSAEFSAPLFDHYATFEGALTSLDLRFADNGTADTHESVLTFGDGAQGLVATATDNGHGTIHADHVYREDGTYPLGLCVTDDDGGTACHNETLVAYNLPPDVTVPPSATSSTHYSFVDLSYQDPGVDDTHTATVDWGDGSPPVPIGAASYQGAGLLAGDHVYPGPGQHTVTVCVTDDDGGTGCASWNVTVVGPEPPTAHTEPSTGHEGVPLAHGVAFEDPNPDAVVSVVLDWGDGTTTTLDPFPDTQAGRGARVLYHTYADDGVYPVHLTVCDETERCAANETTATVLNLPPTPLLDQATVPEDGTVLIDAIANDLDVAADMPLGLVSVGTPAHGTATMEAGQVRYVPTPDYFGPDTFTYVVTDGVAEATGVVEVLVGPINDPPIAVDDVYLLTEDAAQTLLEPLANDLDIEGAVHLDAVLDGPLRGNLTTDTEGGVLQYTPESDDCTDATGPYDVTYRIRDEVGATATANIQIHVACVNDAPLVRDETYGVGRYEPITGNVLDNDEDVEDGRPYVDHLAQAPAAGSVDIAADGTFTYTPDPARFEGQDKFVYFACDLDGACDHATAWLVEVGCGEDGLAMLDGTLVVGGASGIVHEEIEPRLARYSPEGARLVHDLTCLLVVPLEDEVDRVTKEVDP